MKDEPPEPTDDRAPAYSPLAPMSQQPKRSKSRSAGKPDASRSGGAKGTNGRGRDPGKSGQDKYLPPNTARVLASTLGCLPASMLASAVLARYLPLPSPVSLALAYLLWLPIWIAAACWCARAQSGTRAWLFVALATAIPAALLFLVPH